MVDTADTAPTVDTACTAHKETSVLAASADSEDSGVTALAYQVPSEAAEASVPSFFQV